MDDRWMRALLRPLDLLAFLSMTPVPSDARTPHPGRVPPARRPIPGRASDGDWTVRWPRPPPAAPGDNGPPARELAEGPRPGAAGNGEKKNEHIGE